MHSDLFKHMRGLALSGLVALALTGCSLFTGDDGRNDPAPLTEFAPGISAQIAWRTPIGSGTGLGISPAVGRETAYAASADGQVAKLELANGSTIWKTNVGKKISAGPGSDGQITAVVAADGTVIALDDTGQIKWQSKATSEVTIPPAVGYGVVIVRSGDYRLQAFNAENGERIWSVQRPGPALALRAPSRMLMAEGMVITGMPGGKMMAINAQSGDVQWEGMVAIPKGSTDLERVNDVVGEPILVGPLLCGVAFQGKISCFDVSQGGRTVWSKDFSSSSGMTVDGKNAYAASSKDIISAFALQNGNVVWRQDALRNRKLSSPAANERAVAFGDFQGYVHFLSPDDGRLIGRLSLGGGAIMAPLTTTADQGILVQAGDSSIVLIRAN